VNLNDLITNNHGSLQWGRPGGADFQQSCSGDALAGSKLTSSCVASVEVKKFAQIDLNEKITNDNGKLTYIGDEKVVVDPGPPPPPPHGPTMADLAGIAWGVDENGSAQAELLDKIVDLGVHRVRVDFPWDLIEPTRGQWKWGRYEDFVAAAGRRHVDILGILDYGVKWANTGVYPPNGDSKAPPDDFKDFTDYAKAVVEHFKGRPGAPKAYEIWNEPNAGSLNWHEPTCQSHTIRGSTTLCPSTGVSHAPRLEATGVYGDSHLFGALTVDTINAIRGDGQLLRDDIPLLAPGGTIFLWEPFIGLAGNTSGPDFMNEAFSANPELRSLSDAVTLHGYNAYPPSSEPENAEQELGTTNVQLGDKIAKMKAAFTANGTLPSKPVWLTEIGWPTLGFVDEELQARWLIRSIVLAALNGVDRMYIYKMYDGPSAFPEDHLGLVGQDRKAKKKAYGAIQRFMQELGSLRVQSRIPAHDVRNSTYIVQLADGSGPQAWVVWDSAADHHGNFFRWKLPANTSCEGIFGEPCAFSPNGELEVTAEPVYVVSTPRLTRGPR
jgi:hypothetical protein